MQASEQPRRAPWIACFDAFAVAAFAIVWLDLGSTLAAGPAHALFAAICLGLPLGYLIADAVSGLVHWFADSFFDEDAFLLGPLLIAPFREHHRDAQGITHHGFLEVCGNNCAASLVLLVPAAASVEPVASFSAAFFVALLLSTTLFVFATNGFHRWAHMEHVPGWVGWLQGKGIILSPEHHAQHHAGAHDRAYCVTSGWLNPALDRSGVLRRINAWASNHGRRRAAH